MIGDTDFQVLTTPTPNDITTPDNDPTYSCNDMVSGNKDKIELRVDRENLPKSVVIYTNQQIKSLILTLLDSGANDSYFTDRALFTTYTPLSQATPSLGARQDLTFQIVKRGSVKLESVIDGEVKKITLNNMLHIPALRSNLISVLKLSEKGANVSFNNRFAFVTVKNGINIITATHLGQLYVVNINKGFASTFTTQAKKTAVSFNTWHCQLGHAGADSIKKLITKKLVDGLNTDRELMMKGRCENCIFGKHSTYPFNNHGIREEEVLERVHLDIWGPARVKSAGGASYFIMIIDGFLSF